MGRCKIFLPASVLLACAVASDAIRLEVRANGSKRNGKSFNFDPTRSGVLSSTDFGKLLQEETSVLPLKENPHAATGVVAAHNTLGKKITSADVAEAKNNSCARNVLLTPS